MSSEDVIELGSSDDEAEPAPKKKKPMPDAMVVIPNKLPGLTIKPAQPNQYRKQKGVLSKPIIVNKSICNINSNVNRKKTVGGPLQLPYNTNTKVVKTVIPAQNKVYNPLSVSKNLIGPRLLLPKPQIKGLKNQTEAKGSKLINNLPPGITIKLIQNATEVNKKKIRSSQNPGEVLTVDIDDEEMSATSTSSPQWYIRPEDQVEEKKEHITENSEHEVQLSMEEQNNKEPENSRYVEITIEDSPLKPLPQKNGTNKDTAIIIEDSPAKVITQNSQKVESDCESNDRNEPQSKKRLDYPKENNYERQVVEIEIDLMDSGEQSHIKRIDNKELQKCKDKDKEYTEFGNKIHAKSNVEVTVQTKESVDASNSEFHPVYQDFIDVCFKLENSDDMKKIVDKKIKAYYKQCPKEYVESEDFIDLVSSKIVSMKMGPEKMYLYIKDIVDELNLQRKMAKSTIVSSKEDIQQDTIKTSATHKECEYDNKKRKQIRKLEKTIKKLHRAIQKLEEQEIDFDDEQDSVYLLTERYKERMVRVHQKFCQLTNTKMPSEPRIHIESRPGRPTGPAKRLEKWINKKVTIGSPLPFPDFHDVLRCVRDANEEDRLGWNECDVMDEARDLFTRCGKKLQRRRQENEWRLAASRITQDKDPAEENIDLRKRLDDNKILSSEKEGELLKKYVDKQNQLNLEAVEIGDKEAEESPLESDEEEEEEEIESKDSVEDKQKRKEKLTKLLQEKSEPTRDKKNDLKPIKETEEGIEDKVDDQEQKLIDDKSDDKHTTEPNLEVHTENLETEEVVKSTENVKESTDKKDQVKTGNESDSDKVSSDVDELLLYQKSRKCHDHELNILSNESSDSESPNVISDILKSESEGEMDKILSDDVISIEDSSYSESETTYDRITTNYSKNVDNLVNSNFEIEYSSTTFVTEEPTVQQDNVDEDVLLASSDEEANKDEDAEIGDTCINLKDDNISISETTVDGENLEQDSIRNNERSDTPDNNNQLKMVLENCTNSEDTMIQEYSEDENEVLKNKTIEGTDSNDSPKEVVDMECISDGNSDENASVEMQTDVNKDEAQFIDSVTHVEVTDSSCDSKISETVEPIS